MSDRSRINRNRRKRIHAAELRRHEREVDGEASTPWPRQSHEQTTYAPPNAVDPTRSINITVCLPPDSDARSPATPKPFSNVSHNTLRETEEQQWRVTWGLKSSA